VLLSAACLLAGTAGCGPDEPTEPAGPAVYTADGRPVGPVPQPASPPNLIVIMIDTLRADALRIEGGAGPGVDPEAMPFLRSLAEKGVAFTDATAPAPWTAPSIASFLTGLLPSAHGAVERDRPTIPMSLPTFAEILRHTYGYETGAFVGGPWFGGDGSLLQGFETGTEQFALQGTKDAVGEWQQFRDRSKPFFLFLHTFEAHDPYGQANHPWPLEPHLTEAAPDGLPTLDEPWALTRAFLLDRPVRRTLGRTYGLGGSTACCATPSPISTRGGSSRTRSSA
jgi:hypothetical protein